MNIEGIEKLVYDLYHNPESNGMANTYLTLAQVSPEAWDFCWALLDKNKPFEVQYFGASTLHSKLSKFWNELDTQEKKTLIRSRILEALCSFMNDGRPREVQRRLCVCLAAYVVRTSKDLWPTSIPDLIKNFNPTNLSNIPPNKILQVLAEILKVIPEEYKAMHLAHGEKATTRNSLMQYVNCVFGVVESILQPKNDVLPFEIQQTCIQIFSNWSQLLGPLVLSDVHEPILDLILDMIRNDDLAPFVVEAIVAIYSHPEIHKYPNSVLKLVGKMNQLESLISEALNDRNMEACTTLYTFFIQIGETHSRLLLDAVVERPEHRENILKLITVILQCSATPGYYPIDENCSEQAFNFWYTFQDDVIASDQEKIPNYLSLFSPLYLSLIDTLLIKVQFPPDYVYEKEWSSEDKESFRCYRQDIGDTFMYSYNMLRVSMLSNLLDHFKHGLNHLQNSTYGNSERPWQHLEAVLFAFNSIAENVDVSEDVFLLQIFESLPNVPFTQINAPRLLCTTMNMIGSYCEWIYNHPSLLPIALSLLVMGLKGQDIAIVSATMALKDITRECQILVKPYSRQLLNAFEEALRSDSPLKSRERARVMCSIGQILATLPYEDVINYLGALLPPILNKVTEFVNPSDPNNCYLLRDKRYELAGQLNCIAMLFATLDPSLKQIDPEEDSDISTKRQITVQTAHPVYPLISEILPLLSAIGAKWSEDDLVVEAVSECIKKAIITLLDGIKPLVSDIVQLLSQLYKSSFQSSLLDILKQLILLFYVDSSLKLPLISCYSFLCDETLRHVSQNMRHNTALIEYFYTISVTILKKVPEVYQGNSLNLLSLFQCAVATLALPERPTVKAASSFITEFISKSRENESMSIVVNSEGESLLGQVFTVIGGTCDSPRNVVEHMADILMALNQKYFDNLCRWLSLYVHKQGFPTARVSTEQKEQFTKSILRERKNKRKLKDLVNEFSLICRGLIGSEYAEQMSKLPF